MFKTSTTNNEACNIFIASAEPALPDVIAKKLHYSSQGFCQRLAQWVAEQIARVNAAQTPDAAREIRDRFDEIESANAALYNDYKQTHRRPRRANKYDDMVGAPGYLQDEEELFVQYVAASWLRAFAESRIRELLFG